MFFDVFCILLGQLDFSKQFFARQIVALFSDKTTVCSFQNCWNCLQKKSYILRRTFTFEIFSPVSGCAAFPTTVSGSLWPRGHSALSRLCQRRKSENSWKKHLMTLCFSRGYPRFLTPLCHVVCDPQRTKFMNIPLHSKAMIYTVIVRVTQAKWRTTVPTFSALKILEL